MDSASLTSLTPILDGIDRWFELAPLLPVLISLELILSADNAVALASITKKLESIQEQKLALNFGIALSLIFRLSLIIMAEYILKYSVIKLCAGLYLLSLFINKLIEKNREQDQTASDGTTSTSLLNIILLLAFTDIAFSIDSIAAAVAISDQILLVITGAIIGVIALRFTSGLFIRWLEIYERLELAGYIVVAIIGSKLIFQLLFNNVVIPEYSIFGIMILLFIWGFSKKTT